MSEIYSKKRVAKNSVTLYARMLITMFVNLYATRLVLQNLGVEDYGIYGVVGGVVGFFALFSDGLSNAIQRFIIFETGRESGNTNMVFCTSLNIIIFLSLFIFVIIESIGLYYLWHVANIPISKFKSANLVFQFCVISSILNLISIPYIAILTAYEKMSIYAVVTFIQSILGCASAYLISMWPASERLSVYALLMMFVSLIVRLVYQIYCNYKFKETKYKLIIDINIIKKIGKFTGVTTMSGGIKVFSHQCIVLIINLLYGVTINAVYMIGKQIEMSCMSFGMNVYRAISPQIIKTYAHNDIDVHKKLVYSGSKIGVFLIYLVVIPLLIKTDWVVTLWLGEVPAFTLFFVRWSVVLSVMYTLVNPISDAVRASNKINFYFLIPESLYLLTLPLIYIGYEISPNPSYVMIIIVVIQLAMLSTRLLIASKVTIIDLKSINYGIIIPCVRVGVICMLIGFFISVLLPNTFFGLLSFLLFTEAFSILAIYKFGLAPYERQIVINIIRKW